MNSNNNERGNQTNQDNISIQEDQEDHETKQYKIIQRKIKINGFSTPLTIHQIASWMIYLAEAIWVFYIFIDFLKESTIQQELNLMCQQVIYLTLNCLFFLLTFLFGFISSVCNPIDEMIIKQQKGIKIEEAKKTHQCKICNLYVSPKTKHCGVCNKCVFEFDHHCQWLNNCVGQKNYRQLEFIFQSSNDNIF